MTLSIVSTLYKSEGFLDRFLERILIAINELNVKEYELIFVNDGSPDNSLNHLIAKQKDIPEIVIVDLSRNFGHHYAMQAGLAKSQGEYVFLIDNDLETPPMFLVDCYNVLSNDNNLDVVYGYQEERKGKWVENLGGQIFWWGLNKFSDVPVPKNILTERLMRRNFVESLLELGDANLFLGGMFYWTGFAQKGIPVNKGDREGESTYSTKKRLELMVQAITSFSGKPLEYLFYLGTIITFGSLIFIIYLVGLKLFHGDSIQLGWTSLVAINLLLLGMISTFLGLMGIYLFKIFRQVQNRPNYIIKKVYRK